MSHPPWSRTIGRHWRRGSRGEGEGERKSGAACWAVFLLESDTLTLERIYFCNYCSAKWATGQPFPPEPAHLPS